MPGQLVVRERIALEVDGSYLGLLTLNDPENRNPLSRDTIGELASAANELVDDPDVRMIAITGAGSAFSAGGNLKNYLTLTSDPHGLSEISSTWHNFIGWLSQTPKPIVALVNGTSVGGGTELLLACDFAYAARSAKIGDAHQHFGQMGGGGGLVMLPQAVGIARARELLFTGRMLTADEAVAIGLVLRAVDDADLVPSAIRTANDVARMSPFAIARSKQTINAIHWHSTNAHAAFHIEREASLRYNLTAADPKIGMRAFIDKRRPDFVGR